MTYDNAVAQFAKLVPDGFKESYLETLATCRYAADGIADTCEAAFTLTKCLCTNNIHDRFLFP